MAEVALPQRVVAAEVANLLPVECMAVPQAEVAAVALPAEVAAESLFLVAQAPAKAQEWAAYRGLQ